MSEEFEEAMRQSRDLIDHVFGGDLTDYTIRRKRAQIPLVLPDTAPTTDEQDQFEALLQNSIISLDGRGVWMRIAENMSTNLNLVSGYYAFGEHRLEGAMLYMARQLAGWEDPTGAKLTVEE